MKTADGRIKRPEIDVCEGEWEMAVALALFSDCSFKKREDWN